MFQKRGFHSQQLRQREGATRTTTIRVRICVLFEYSLCTKMRLYYRWYVNDMSRQRSESLLKQEDKEGCFVVRNSSTKGLYTLSLYTKV